MMMRKSLLLSFFMCTISICCYAQAHNTSEFAICKYNKNINKFSHEGGTSCARCILDDKKEKEARVVEDKRRLAEAAIKLKEEKRKQDIADKKNREEAAAKNKVTEVFINAPKTTAVVEPKQPTDSKKNIPVGNTGVLTGGISSDFFHINNHNYYSNYFLNRNKDTVLRNSEWKQTFGENDYYPQRNFPAGIGIVMLANKKNITGMRNGKMPICDFVDAKGKRMLNNDSITAIVHFTHDWFIICKQFLDMQGLGNSFSAEDVSIYNIRTKETIKVPGWSTSNQIGSIYLSASTEPYIKSEDERGMDNYNPCLGTKQNHGEFTLYYALKDGSIEIKSFNYN